MANFMSYIFYNNFKKWKKVIGTWDLGERYTIFQPAEGLDPDLILPYLLFWQNDVPLGWHLNRASFYPEDISDSNLIWLWEQLWPRPSQSSYHRESHNKYTLEMAYTLTLADIIPQERKVMWNNWPKATQCYSKLGKKGLSWRVGEKIFQIFTKLFWLSVYTNRRCLNWSTGRSHTKALFQVF